MALRKKPAPKRARTRTVANLNPAAVRLLPSVDECLLSLETIPQTRRFRRGYLALMVRRSVEEARNDIASGANFAAGSRDQMREEITRRVQRLIERDETRMRNVVNATGILIHTNLGRAPLAQDAIEAIKAAAESPINLEYDLESGRRGDRDELVEEEICALTGAEAATVVNNNAAAVLLALNSIAEGREVVVSRGELIEIGGSFRIPDVMAKSGARMREVGTTNRTHAADFERAIGAETALLLKVHPSNYRIIGFTASVSLRELARMANARGLSVMEDLGSGDRGRQHRGGRGNRYFFGRQAARRPAGRNRRGQKRSDREAQAQSAQARTAMRQAHTRCTFGDAAPLSAIVEHR
jgi:L-seryl-tRNA(Ser) seleniumtransferase